VYRYILRESCSQLDSLPLTHLTLWKPIEAVRAFVAKRGVPCGEDAATRSAGFVLFDKCEVNGANTVPLWAYLKRQLPSHGAFGAGFIPWNFTKFLVDCRGAPRERFLPTTRPCALAPAIEALLVEGGAAPGSW